MSGQNYIAFIQGHLLFQVSKYYFCITAVYHPSLKKEFMAILIAISSAQVEVSNVFLLVIEEIFRPPSGGGSLFLLFFKYTHINVFLINEEGIKIKDTGNVSRLRKNSKRKCFFFLKN